MLDSTLSANLGQGGTQYTFTSAKQSPSMRPRPVIFRVHTYH